MQMLNTTTWDNVVLEHDLQHLLKVAFWNSAPEMDCAEMVCVLTLTVP